MKEFNKVFLAVIILSAFSCRNYDSHKYISIENQAINDIIPEMIEFEEMVKMNNLDTTNLKLFIISSLDANTAWTEKPNGYYIGLTEKENQENKKEFERELKEYDKEEKLFAPLTNGTINKRNLNYDFENLNLKIELISESDIQSFRLKKNEFRYLSISRIIFNRAFSKGYLSFRFICGEACAWNNNIEISKSNGKWKISQYFSGGIA